jgi:hypothetical protein
MTKDKKLYSHDELVSKEDAIEYLIKRIRMARKREGLIEYWEVEVNIDKAILKQIRKLKISNEALLR